MRISRELRRNIAEKVGAALQGDLAARAKDNALIIAGNAAKIEVVNIAGDLATIGITLLQGETPISSHAETLKEGSTITVQLDFEVEVRLD